MVGTSPPVQNFSLPAGDDFDVVVQVGSDIPSGSVVHWRAYAQRDGVPDLAVVVLTKISDGHGIDVLSPPTSFRVRLDPVDTSALLGSYFHQARVVETGSNPVTVVQGLMTVLPTGSVP